MLYRSRAESGPSDAHVEAGRRAVQEHCERLHLPVEVEALPQTGCYRVRRRYVGVPAVSIVVVAGGSDAATDAGPGVPVLRTVESVLERSTYPDLELVVVADRSIRPRSLPGSGASPPSVCVWSRSRGAPRASRSTSARPRRVARCSRCSTTRSTSSRPTGSRRCSVSAVEPDCGLVGAELLRPDGASTAAGYAGADGVRLPTWGNPRRRSGDGERAGSRARVLGGGNGAAAMVRREVWEEVGGAGDARTDRPWDGDLARKVRHCGYRIVWTPHVVLRFRSAPVPIPTIRVDRSNRPFLFFWWWGEEIGVWIVTSGSGLRLNPAYTSRVVPRRVSVRGRIAKERACENPNWAS